MCVHVYACISVSESSPTHTHTHTHTLICTEQKYTEAVDMWAIGVIMAEFYLRYVVPYAIFNS